MEICDIQADHHFQTMVELGMHYTIIGGLTNLEDRAIIDELSRIDAELSMTGLQSCCVDDRPRYLKDKGADEIFRFPDWFLFSGLLQLFCSICSICSCFPSPSPFPLLDLPHLPHSLPTTHPMSPPLPLPT